jgi:DNA-binding response OmpR family regulator
MARVLIAEDNPEIRQLIERVLQRDGVDVETVEDGEQAIERIGAEHYDAILLDFMMPIASGFDVINWIEENRPDVAKACVIIITAAVHQLKNFDTSKVYAAISKPFDVVELRETVRQCIAATGGAAQL